MITGTRVGRIVPSLRISETCCPRCGIVYNHSDQHVVQGSPCRDCRDVLRREGDTTIWDVRRLRAAS